MRVIVKIKKKLNSFDLDVDFSFNSIMGLMGASGSGKSMTLKCIAGIETPDEGFIQIGDIVVYDSKRKIDLPVQKRRVGYLFQNYALFENMTVKKNIEIASRLSKERVSSLILRLAIQDILELYPRQLSGGQKQRVALCRMLCGDPEILLFDEPVSALDEERKRDVVSMLEEMLKTIDKPCLYVSHDPREIKWVCDTYQRIDRGKFV